MSAQRRILIVEDTPSQAELVRALLAGSGHELKIADSAGGALTIAQTWQPDAILLDLELPDYSGFELMEKLRQEGVDAAVIVITANGSIGTAVEAMRRGAIDFLVKPFNKARLTVTVGNCLETRTLVEELKTAKQLITRDRFFNFIGASPPMQAAYRTIESVAASKASVFITGESGTGKELAAEAVHKASPRRSKPFIALNCGAIPRDLLESEIFGHMKGAFTGATDNRIGAAKAADGGTLFLDEIGEMPLDMQVKLLRFVQTGSYTPVGGSRVEKVDVRFVCATNRDPLQEVQEGRFREDLFYRLYVVPVELPPLRDRGEDVLLIARHFLKTFAKEESRAFRAFSPEAERALMAYSWPGNVRQLQNVVRNIVVLHDGEMVDVAWLPQILLRASSGAPRPVAPVQPAPSQPAPSQPAPSPMAITSDPIQFAPPPAHEAEPVDSDSVAFVEETVPQPVAEPVYAYAEPAMAHAVAPVFEPREVLAASPAPAEIEIMPLAQMEKRMILRALEITGQDVPRAAAMLEVNPSTIYRKLQSWRSATASASTV